MRGHTLPKRLKHLPVLLGICVAMMAAGSASLHQPDIADRLKKSAAEKWPGTAEDLAALAKAELETYGKVARDIGLQKQ